MALQHLAGISIRISISIIPVWWYK